MLDTLPKLELMRAATLILGVNLVTSFKTSMNHFQKLGKGYCYFGFGLFYYCWQRLSGVPTVSTHTGLEKTAYFADGQAFVSKWMDEQK